MGCVCVRLKICCSRATVSFDRMFASDDGRVAPQIRGLSRPRIRSCLLEGCWVRLDLARAQTEGWMVVVSLLATFDRSTSVCLQVV